MLEILNDQAIVVSVCMLTYNHSCHLEAAIQGVLMQKTNFRIELVIGEDCSTDNTRSICIKYKNKYPEVINLLFSNENIGMVDNSIRTLKNCSGKYIAMCEGDDYWIDPYKLQKQVDFMEEHLDYSLVYHKVCIYQQKDKIYSPEFINTSNKEKSFSIEDLANGNFIHTPSVLFRRESLDMHFLSEIDIVQDYTCWMLCAEKGQIKYLPNIMAVYRIWGGSMWELKDNIFKISQMLFVMIPLLNRFCTKENIYSILFQHFKLSYTQLYLLLKDKDEDEILDKITKKTLLNLKYIQTWWFSYMIHHKASRKYRLKYFIYLVRMRSLTSIKLIKKCVY